MKDSTKLYIVGALFLILLGHFAGIYTLSMTAPYFQWGKEAVTPTPTPGAGYPIVFMVLCQNGTGIGGATVEVYVPTAEANVWALKSSATTSSTAGEVGKFTSTISFAEGSSVLIHVKSGTYSGKKVVQAWFTATVPKKGADATTIVFADPYKADVAPSSSSTKMDMKLFDKSFNAIGESDAAATSISKAAGAADFSGNLQLIISETWTAFGGSYDQPKTDQGHKARSYVSVITVEMNRTDISWKSGDWSQVSGTTTTKKYAIVVNRLQAKDTQPVFLTIPIAFDASTLADNTAFKATVHWYDNQLFDDIKGGVVITTVGVNDGYTYDAASHTFYLKATA